MSVLTDKNDLTTGVVWKKLMGFFFPVLLGLLFQQLYNTADAFIVGRFEGDNALAAVGGSASTLTNLIIGFFTGLNGGATVLIAQYYGARDDENVSRVLHTSIVFCTIAGIVIALLGILIAPSALRLLNNPEDIMEDSVLYLRIYFTGAPLLLLYNLFQGTLQGVGDSKRPLIYLIVSCLFNIAADLLFVAVFRMGVAGAAIASVLSMLLCAVMAVVFLMRVDGPHRIVPTKLSVRWDVLRKILRIGLPSGLQGSMYSISNTIILSAINSFGTATVSAWTATGKLDGFYWVTSNAFGIAICSFVGQCWGAGKYERMKRGIRVCLRIALCSTVCLSALLLLSARAVYSAFLSSPDTIDMAIQIMWYIVPFYFVWSFVEVFSGSFRGTGDTLRPMIIVMLGTCLLRVLWIFFVLPHWKTLLGISIVYGISWLVTAVVFIIYYLKGYWLRGCPDTEIRRPR